MKIVISKLFIFCLSIFYVQAQNYNQPTRQDTLKGSITPERAWWNVIHYDLTIQPDYKTKTLIGKNTIEFEIIEDPHARVMQIDLQAPLQIDSILIENIKTTFTQEGAAWFVKVPEFNQRINTLTVFYSGTPKESFKPPYDGGIIWTTDSLNRPWISVACQMVGGSVWYPCKDHYSDEPDNGASVTIIVPDSLIAIGNGRLTESKSNDGNTSYTWKVINPINNYGLTFYAGHYINIKENLNSESGELNMTYWVIDYNRQKAENHMIPEIHKTMEAFEYWFGPYPFYDDGFQMVEAPYIGMEHQSAIAYGNQFRNGRFKFKNLSDLDYRTDRLIVHEMAHEWYGNNITMSDMADRWVQEGFAALGEELMMEYHFGKEVGTEFFLTRQRNFIKNKYPLISRYGVFEDAGPDMYFKGWALVHMLREIIDDDDKFRLLLREMNSKFHLKTIHSIDLEDFISEYTEIDFSKVFDQYLRHSEVPVVEYKFENSKLKYRLVADVEGLEMPIKINSPIDTWLIVKSNWQELIINSPDDSNSLIVDPNFLLEISLSRN